MTDLLIPLAIAGWLLAGIYANQYVCEYVSHTRTIDELRTLMRLSGKSEFAWKETTE